MKYHAIVEWDCQNGKLILRLFTSCLPISAEGSAALGLSYRNYESFSDLMLRIAKTETPTSTDLDNFFVGANLQQFRTDEDETD